MLDQLSQEMGLHFAKVDFTDDENRWLARELGVTATPTIWGFVEGTPVRPPLIGLMEEDEYRDVFGRFQAFAAQRTASH